MGQGLAPAITSAGQIPTANPALASNPAPPQAPQVQTPLTQQSGGKSSGGSSSSGGGKMDQMLKPPPDPAQTQGQQPQMGQPNPYSQTVGMGDNTASQTPSPQNAGGKSGKGGV